LAGSASGLMGALQIASAALAAEYIGQLSLHQPGRFGIVILVVVGMGFILYNMLDMITNSPRAGNTYKV
jgi:DHA1 family bicyclomycin/chloramphenicol resistance-like MFS transporter